MSSRRSLLKSATALVAAALLVPGAAAADEPLPVVATFSILGDMVQRIGGDNVALTTLVGPDGDTHVYQPTPQAAAAVAGAEVVFMNGLEFEGWLERLVEAASFDGELVVATVGVDVIEFGEDGHDDHDDHGDHDDHDHDKEEHADHEDHDHDHDKEEHAEADDHDHDHDKEEHADADGHDHDHDHDHGAEEASAEAHDDHDHDDHHGHDHGAFDPHAWQTVENAIIYVDNVTAGLAKADPANAATYYANRAEYVAELEALEADIDALIATIPEDKRTVVTAHDAFGYFAAHYGITFTAPQGQSTESEASAADVAALIRQIREEGISAVFVESVADSRLISQIANETGAVVGGTLYAGALSDSDGPAATYIDMLRHNAETIAEALAPQG